MSDPRPPLKIGIVSPYGYPHPGGVNEHVRYQYEEMRRMGSLIVRIADEVKVPAGSALAVDRHLFARRVTEAVEAPLLPKVTHG